MKNLIAKLIILICIIFSANSTQAQWFGSKKVKGNGNVITKTRATKDYHKIKCAGSLNYVLVKGKEGNITLKGEENLLDYIVTEVKDGKLIVKTKNNVYLKPSNNKPITITIPFEDIETVSLSGSGDLTNKDTIREDTLNVYLSGSGDVILNVEANYLHSGITGSGDVTIKGNTEELKVVVTGSGDFHGFNLQAKDVSASVTGSGDADVYCTNSLKARVTGSGDIEYKGNPKTEDSRVTGSGDISSY